MALTIDGTNGIILPVGSLTKPSLGTAGAGMHVPVANTLAFVTNSQSRITIDSSGTVTVANNFVVSGNTTVSGTTIPIGKTLVTLDDNQTLSGKTISGSNNTISNIANASLSNSAITFGATAQALGSTVSALNAVSIGQSTAAAGSFTTLSASSTVSGTGFSTYLASPPAIGGTTPAAGNFTTLGATGNVTLGDATGDTLTINAGTTTFAQGTANGVLYLNGSKVATSGSALTFDGTNFGVGASSLTYRFNAEIVSTTAYSAANTLSAAPVAWFYNSTNTANVAATIRLDAGTNGGNSATTISAINTGSGTSALTFGTRLTGGDVAERARITSKGLLVGYTDDSSLSSVGNAIFSGNVGIGTSSPATYGLLSALSSASQPLAQINALTSSGYNSPFTASVYIGSLRTDNVNNGAVAGYRFKTYAADATGANLTIESASSATGSLNPPNVFNTLVTLSSSGNLGLGVTPSAWSVIKAIQIGSGYGSGLFADNGSSQVGIASNAYYSSTGWKYFATGYASYFDQFNGQHRWLTAASGTAGNAISFTQAMTLDASGRLVVGGTANPYSANIVSNSGITDLGSQYNTARAGANYEFVNRTAGYGFSFYVNGATVVATLSSSGVWTDASDAKYKENIENSEYGLQEILQLTPRTYNIIGNDKKQIGFVAQEVIDIVPELVGSTHNSVTQEDRYTLSYGQMSAVLVKAIQELHAEIEQLKMRIN